MHISEPALNRLKLLKAIRRWGPVARNELMKRTGLSNGSMTLLTAELLDRGLIIERKEELRRPGRPRIFLEVVANKTIVMGASLRGQSLLTSAFVDLAGTLLLSIETPLKPAKSLAELAANIADSLEAAIGESKLEREKIGRIGLALPAVVDAPRGEVHFMPTFPVSTVPFAKPISQRMNLPVTIEHETACKARGEHWAGVAQDLDTFTLIDVAHWLGSAEYADGVPRLGANGLNPEFGHLKTDFSADAPQCICGARGCVAMFASVYGILDQAHLLVGQGIPSIEAIEEQFGRLLDRADADDNEAITILDRAGTHLGRALANHININDPGIVLISVLEERFLKRISDAFHASLIANATPGVLPSTEVRLVVADQEWRQTGPANLALEQTYLGGI